MDMLAQAVAVTPGFAPLWMAYGSALQGRTASRITLIAYDNAIKLNPVCGSADQQWCAAAWAIGMSGTGSLLACSGLQA